ncbi:hypothetical protein AMATHDRAFT_41663 [Amanita thiersii Skay4041]|uniref:Extracellular serine-rich protein n=1 Tax=Amanita thiersii Skay4041 TaxID=703135 RepID=A0A2A9NLU2_9AGAR|nr:hypothetical protein AMATHDRAFT_41663 [Amanita thiersii Skay4041]
MSLALVVLWLTHPLAVYAQTTLTVQVGSEGSFYDPNWLNAVQGDTIRFVFSGRVVQTMFEKPCFPLAGGFNSGLFGRGPNPTEDTPAPVWDLIIANDSEPIWFYCEVTVPRPHCAEGMVGYEACIGITESTDNDGLNSVINLPLSSSSMFSAFTAAAKAVTGTPSATPSVTLTGVGAYATASPAPTSASITTPTSSIITPTAAPITHAKSHNAGKIAGAVCGVVGGLLAFLCLLIWYRRRLEKPLLGKSNSKGYPNHPASPAPGVPQIVSPMLDINNPLHKGKPNTGEVGVGVGGILPMKVERTMDHPTLPVISAGPQFVHTYHSNSSGSQVTRAPPPPGELVNQHTPPSGLW